MSATAPLRVFLSYVHENAQHRARVKTLALRLSEAGVEVTLDQDWPAPPEGWPLWVEREVTAADVVLMVMSQGFASAFADAPLRWPGPVVLYKLFLAEGGHRPFVPVVFDLEDAAWRPAPLVQQTFYPVETAQDISLLLRILRTVVQPPPPAVKPATKEEVRLGSPLPPLDEFLSGLQARLSLHRRAWRFFRSKLEGLGITLAEEAIAETGAQKLTGPGITITLTQHSEHAEARLDILPGTAPVYATLLGLVTGARQPIECSYLVFTLKPEWKLTTPPAALASRLADSDIKASGPQGLMLHGWRFVIPAMSLTEPNMAPLKIVPRPPYPWPLNPLRLFFYLLQKHGALYRE